MEVKDVARSPSVDIPVSEAPAEEHAGTSAGSVRRRRRSFHWSRWAILVFIFILAGTGSYYWTSHREPQVRYITAPAKYGNVAVSLTATGTVNPVTVVEVGT
jgi:HlyD family secretion protein